MTTRRPKVVNESFNARTSESAAQDTLYIGNITESITDEELQTAFTKVFGRATLSARRGSTVVSSQTPRLQFCFFKFDSAEGCAKALSLAESSRTPLITLHGRPILVKPRESRAQKEQRQLSSPRHTNTSSSPVKSSSSQGMNPREPQATPMTFDSGITLFDKAPAEPRSACLQIPTW